MFDCGPVFGLQIVDYIADTGANRIAKFMFVSLRQLCRKCIVSFALSGSPAVVIDHRVAENSVKPCNYAFVLQEFRPVLKGLDIGSLKNVLGSRGIFHA